MIITSVVATVEHRRRLIRRHVCGAIAAGILSVVLTALALFALRAEMRGEPWPAAAVTGIAVLLGSTMLGVVIAVSLPALLKAQTDVGHVNRQAMEGVRSELLAEGQRLRADLERRGDVGHRVVAWLERLDGDVTRLGGLIDRAREQGRVEAEQSARIREAHLRDAWAAEALRIRTEDRAAARRELAGLLDAMRAGLRDELAAVIGQVEARSRTDGFAEGYVSGIARREEGDHGRD